MTDYSKIPTGDTLEMQGPNGKVWGRLIHLGNGACNSERRLQDGTWGMGKTGMTLTDAQAAEWIRRKAL